MIPGILYLAGKVPGVAPMHRREELMHALGHIPGVTSARERGVARLREHLAAERGDADVLGIIKTDGGWEFIPLDMVGEGDNLWGVPRDSDEPAFPADGLPEEPQTLLGTPVAFGYKEYGAVTELPQFDDGSEIHMSDDGGPSSDGASASTPAAMQLSRAAAARLVDDRGPHPIEELLDDDLVQQLDDGDDGDSGTAADGGDGSNADSSADTDSHAGASRLRAAANWVLGWPGRRYRGLRARLRRRRERKRCQRYKAGWHWLRGGANALVLQQDGDARYAIEPADYHKPNSDEAVWNGYKTDSGLRYDAREHGGEPARIYGGVSLGVCFGPTVKLLAPSVCRVGRNLHNVRLQRRPVPGVAAPQSPSPDAATNGDGSDTAAADGGQLFRDAIEIEERALVSFRDIKLHDNEDATQEYVQRAVEQSKALANPPGGNLGEKALKSGIVLVAILIGALVGDPGLFVQLWHGLTGLALGVSLHE